ncbi:MAG: hypothetical protein ACYS9Y_04520 [Planctomycetota bacterium]|jgi:hypothetical protein
MNNKNQFILILAAVVLFTSPAYLPAETVLVDMGLTIPAQTNRLEMTVEAEALSMTRDDSDSATLTGNALAYLQVNFDRFTYEVNDVSGLEFTGGSINFSDTSFHVDFGFSIGDIYVSGTAISGPLDTPNPPQAVSGTTFNASEHQLILNNGNFHVSGTGMVGDLFDPFTINLFTEPIVSSNNGTGTILVSLLSVDGHTATYQTSLTMPIFFSKQIFSNSSVTIYVTGVGTLEASGQFTRCTLWADLTDDCHVNLYDLAEFCDQWLAYDVSEPCPLIGDLTGDDCYVNIFDFAILAYEWLQ